MCQCQLNQARASNTCEDTMAWSSMHCSTYNTNSFQFLSALLKVCSAAYSLQQLFRQVLQRFDATCCYQECLLLSRIPILLKRSTLSYLISGERDPISKSFESLQIFTCLQINEVASDIFFAHLQVIIQCTMQGQFNQK